LIQCGGLWFVNGKVSITWNLKQAIVQKPKNSMEGQCLLKPKAADKEKLKTMELPVESMVDPDGGVSAMVEDSDEDDDEEIEIAPLTMPVLVKEPEPEPEPVKIPTPVVASEEPKKKRVITKKKVEA
jgi:hypothetical protein